MDEDYYFGGQFFTFGKFIYGFLRAEIPALRDQYSSAPRPNFQ